MKQDIKNKIESIISNPNAYDKEIIFQLKQLLYDVELQYVAEKESKSIADLVSESLNQLNSTTQPNIIKSGFPDFDNSFNGFGLGEFVVIGGRPSMGKTQLMVNLALNISLETPILYFTFDLSISSLTNRFISSLSGIGMDQLLQHTITDEKKEKLALVEKEFSKHKIFINDNFNASIVALKAHCKKMIEEKGVKVIFVDYIQMMSSNKYRNSREFEISYIIRELKSIAKDFNVCVIATSQLSRAVETRIGSKYPQLSDLRDSGTIEQDADKVIFIYRPEYYGIEFDEDSNSTTGITELILAKNRNGKLGTIKLLRDTEFTNYRNYEYKKYEFSFSASRLSELKATNPNVDFNIDNLDVNTDIPPF